MPTLVKIDPTLGTYRGHTFTDGSGNLWHFGHTQIGTFRPAVFKSTDSGATWHEQDAAHASTNADNGGGPVSESGGIHFFYDASSGLIWFAYCNIKNFPNFNVEFQTFNIATGLYAVPFGFSAGHGPNMNGSGGDAGEIIEDFVVLNGTDVIIFYGSILNTFPAQLEWDLFSWHYNTTTGWDANGIKVATNQPTGISGNQTRGDAIGMVGLNTATLGVVFQVAQDHSGSTGIPTYALYYRTVAVNGTLGSITTIQADGAYGSGIFTERYGSLLALPAFLTGLDPHDGLSGTWRKTWLSFQNLFVSGSNILTSVVHNGKPAAAVGTPLTAPVFTLADLDSPTGLEEVNVVSGQTAAWIYETAAVNDSINYAQNGGGGWGAPSVLYNTPGNSFEYVWPVAPTAASFYDYLQRIPYFLAASGAVAPTCNLTDSILGGNLTLAWTTTNSPTSATFNQGIGSVNPAGGSITIPLPLVTTTYILTVTNSAGSSTCQVTVTITPPPPAAGAAVLEWVGLGGNGVTPGKVAGFGNVYTIPTDPQGDPVLLTDDDYGQINPYYITYGFVNHEQEMALQLGAHRKQLQYLTAIVQGGAGNTNSNITVTALVNQLTNAWPLNVTRALAAIAIHDLEWGGGGAQGQRIFFKFSSSPISGTDNGFQLQKCVPAMKPAARLPVRGAL